MHTKIRNNIFFIVFALAFVVVTPPVKAQKKYSIDQEQKKRKVRKPFFIKRWFMNSEEKVAKKQIKKDQKKEDKIRANQQKRIESEKIGRGKTFFKGCFLKNIDKI